LENKIALMEEQRSIDLENVVNEDNISMMEPVN
jgi:hypothetical protein